MSAQASASNDSAGHADLVEENAQLARRVEELKREKVELLSRLEEEEECVFLDPPTPNERLQQHWNVFLTGFWPPFVAMIQIYHQQPHPETSRAPEGQS